ncbi:MAG: Cj0069 family protein [Anaerolineaceae bacterium]|nr:Cj0069 family protein [Anaerolineaceae bacterium]
MSDDQNLRIAIVYPGDLETRKTATANNNRFSPLFQALAALNTEALPAVYHPDFADEVYQQLLTMDGVLVWVNPIQDGHDRSILDAMLRQVADAGVFVSTHPDIIMKMGTKEILFQTRHMEWGTDTHVYSSLADMRQQLPGRLVGGTARVLKRNRGHSGSGVWKVQTSTNSESITETTLVRARHAERGSVEGVITLGEFLMLCEPYFAGGGKIIDQAYQTRLPEGMIRCYLVHDKVAGFGHQAINALYPTPEGASPEEAPQPGPRLYYPPDLPDFQRLKQKLEQKWVPELQALLDISTDHLPVLWDADFLLGPNDNDFDTYVLCEVNVSSVAPYPDSTTPFIAEAALIRARIAREQRQSR